MIQNTISSVQLNKIPLNKGESLYVEPSAMAAYSKNIEMTTNLNDSVWNVAARHLFGGESVFLNKFSARAGNGWVALDNGLEQSDYPLSPGEQITLTPGAFVACDSHVTPPTTEYAGIKGWWSGIGMVMLKLTNTHDCKTGRVYFNTTHGIIRELKIHSHDGPTRVDTKNLLGYTGNLRVSTHIPAGLKSYFVSGERYVNTFEGTGSVFLRLGGSREAEAAALRAESAALRAEKIFLKT